MNIHTFKQNLNIFKQSNLNIYIFKQGINVYIFEQNINIYLKYKYIFKQIMNIYIFKSHACIPK